MSNSIDLILENTKNKTSSVNKIATIYKNEDATLEVTLINNTSDSIDLTGSEAKLQLPLFLNGVTGMKVSSKPSGYADATYDAHSRTFTLKHSGAGKWDIGGSNALKFTIENIKTNTQPPKKPEQFVVLISAGSPYVAQQSIALTLPPASGNITPSEVIDFKLQNDHILISDPDNPLPDANTLKLTLSTKTGDAIDFDKTLSPNARITVSFLVGNTNSCLAQENNTGSTGEGSIKNIKVAGGSTNWSFTQAYSTSGAVGSTGGTTNSGPAMSNDWVLTTNSDTILGGSGSQDSTVTFEFENIYSFTDIGTTLMYIYFSGFNISDKQAYNDEYIILPIFKDSITPKLSNFSIDPTIIKYDSSGKLNTYITPSWQLDPPEGKTAGDVHLQIKVTSTKDTTNNKISTIEHSQNGQPLNLLTYCTWTKDLSNEEGIEVEIIATVRQTSIALSES